MVFNKHHISCSFTTLFSEKTALSPVQGIHFNIIILPFKPLCRPKYYYTPTVLCRSSFINAHYEILENGLWKLEPSVMHGMLHFVEIRCSFHKCSIGLISGHWGWDTNSVMLLETIWINTITVVFVLLEVSICRQFNEAHGWMH